MIALQSQIVQDVNVQAGLTRKGRELRKYPCIITDVYSEIVYITVSKLVRSLFVGFFLLVWSSSVWNVFKRFGWIDLHLFCRYPSLNIAKHRKRSVTKTHTHTYKNASHANKHEHTHAHTSHAHTHRQARSTITPPYTQSPIYTRDLPPRPLCT